MSIIMPTKALPRSRQRRCANYRKSLAKLRACFILPFCVAMAPLATSCSAEPGQPDLSRAVGWLAPGGQAGPCQGVAIAPDRVLTAAHCVADPASWGAPAAGELQFLTGAHAFAVVETTLPAERSIAPSGTILDLEQDWAILRVAASGDAALQPLAFGGRRAAWFAWSFDEPVLKAGLVRTGDGSELQTATCAIDVFDALKRLATFRCDGGTGPGLSGSPLVLESERGYELIGIMAAKERLPGGDDVGIVVIPPDQAFEAAASSR